MKKILFVFILCAIVILAVFLATNVPSVHSALESLSNVIFVKELEPYTDNFEVNSLKLKNQSFYYNNLSDEKKKIYTAIANGIKNLEKTFTLNNYEIIDNDTTMKDIEQAMQAFFADHPEVFYVDNKYIVSTKTTIFKKYVEIELNYTITSKSELDKKIIELESKINEYLEKTDGKEGMDAELVLHDSLGECVEYYKYESVDNVPQECHSIYGAFITNKAVCDGFSKALQLLLDRKNIESIIVLGKLENESHAWNLVKLGDNWYHVDLTSDKAIKDLSSKIVLHTYFNITTSLIEKTHIFDNKEIIPIAEDYTYNYYFKNDKVIKFEDVFSRKFKSLLDNNKNDNLLEFAVYDIDDVPEQMVDFLSKNKYSEYISNNKITYYSILNSYILVKNNK